MLEENTTRAFWVQKPGLGKIVLSKLKPMGPDDVLVRASYSGISRGTETLVFRGEVPISSYDAMRAPFQEGTFPAPIKFGYISVGVIESACDAGKALVGKDVFCLYPHQDRYVVPASAVTVLPPGVPTGRADLHGGPCHQLSALCLRASIDALVSPRSYPHSGLHDQHHDPIEHLYSLGLGALADPRTPGPGGCARGHRWGPPHRPSSRR